MASVRRSLQQMFCVFSHFFFFSAGCNNATVCPRFNASSSCVGSLLTCSGGIVTRLCVLGSEVSASDGLTCQGLVRTSIDWVDSVDDWTINGNHCVVRFRVDNTVSELTSLRSLATNLLTREIPSTVGQLMALTHLYFIVLSCQSSLFVQRNLYGNLLTGSIHSTIGQLTALKLLYAPFRAQVTELIFVASRTDVLTATSSLDQFPSRSDS
jgi:hypothetical protein